MKTKRIKNLAVTLLHSPKVAIMVMLVLFLNHQYSKIRGR